MKTKTFRVPIYNVRLCVVVADTTAVELNKFLKKKFGAVLHADEVDGADGSCNILDDDVVIWLRRFSPRKPSDMGVLAHECLHATDFILWRAGISMTHSSEEAFNYLLGWMVEKILGWYSK